MAKKKSSKKRKVWTLDIISDGTGNLASHLINAVLTQFPDVDVKKKVHLIKPAGRKLPDLLKKLPKRNHLVLHALVDPALKSQVDAACQKRGIPNFDLTGMLVQFMADHMQCAPENSATRLHEADPGYFKRIQAMEFTAQHDDARRIETARDADVVVLGLSRVSKSPTCTFLGSMGYRAANISIAPESGIPDAVKKVPRKKLVALTIQPKKLHEIRQQRFKRFNQKIEEEGAAELPYGNLKSVIKEVVWAESTYREMEIPIINITHLTIEEAAREIVNALELKPPDSDYA